jgi:hypothetical protein
MSEAIPEDTERNAIRSRRLIHDLRGLVQEAPEGVEAQPLDSACYHWQGGLFLNAILYKKCSCPLKVARFVPFKCSAVP